MPFFIKLNYFNATVISASIQTLPSTVPTPWHLQIGPFAFTNSTCISNLSPGLTIFLPISLSEWCSQGQYLRIFQRDPYMAESVNLDKFNVYFK